MPFCIQCGFEVSDKFCSRCGAPRTVVPSQSPSLRPLPPPLEESVPVAASVTSRPRRSSSWLALLVVLLICLAGLIIWSVQGGSARGRPGGIQAGTADRYVRSVAAGDIKTALALTTSGDAQGVNGAKLAAKMMQARIDWRLSYGNFRGVDILNVDEHGSEATVHADLHFSKGGGDMTLKMVKEGSDWKVRPPGKL
jgi:hypothetical protein